MQESDFSRVLVSSIKARGGFAERMPDPSFAELKRGAPKRPYDLYYVYGGKTVHVEAKFLKGGYQAFNLGRVEDHQYDNLLRVAKNSSPRCALVAVGVWEARVTYDAFFFTAGLLFELKKTQKSIDKKALLRLRDAGWAVPISRQDIDVDRIEVSVICERQQLL